MKKDKNIFKWIIWFLASLFYFYEFILRVSPGVMIDSLMQTFGITASTVGILSAFYLYGYAPMQLPVGMIMDKYGVKKVLSTASLVCGLGAFFFALTNSLPVACAGRMMIGIGSSFAFIAIIYVTSYWFEEGKRGFLIGIANSLAMFGASAGTGPLSMVIKKIGWKASINFFAAFGILLGVLVYFVFKMSRQDEQIEKKTAEEEIKLLKNIKSVISKKNIWLNAFIALLFYLTTTAFGGLWGISFLETGYHVSREVAGYAVSMIFIGWVVGGPLSGLWSDIIGKRTTVIRIGILGTLISLSLVIYFPVHIYIAYILLFLVGLFSSAELLNFSLAIELNSFRAKATVAAFTNFLISCGDAAVQPFIGFILDKFWDNTMLEQVRVYSVVSYRIALSCLPIGLCLAFILLFFIKEKGFKTVSFAKK